jgi:hypothetical protein
MSSISTTPPLKKYSRTRASSFNHSVIRRQQSDSLFNNNNNNQNKKAHTRRPSFDSHNQFQKSIQPKSSHSQFLSVSQHHQHQTASSIDDDSGSEEYDADSIYPSHITAAYEREDDYIEQEPHHQDFVGKLLCKSTIHIYLHIAK